MFTDAKSLWRTALAARDNAYAPYSRFAVGAALACADGRVFTGCNVENASYPVTLCAERTAFAAACNAGAHDFIALAVVGGPVGGALVPCPPCGLCRQTMAEFCTDDFLLYFGDKPEALQSLTLGQLLPHRFDAASLGGQ